MTIIRLENVSKTYRQGGLWGKKREVRAVDGISLNIAPGQCLAVVGPSGSGKSTLGRLALGLERPDSGTVLYKGKALTSLRGEEKRAARRNVQVVFQNSQGAVNPRFTAKDIIGEPLTNFEQLRGRKLSERVAGLLEKVGLSESDMEKLPHQFSGGELQRICLARALAPEPELVVLDEAVSSLDMLNQARVLELIAGIKKDTGTAFLFISHDLRVVCEVADSLAVIDRGKLAGYADDMDAFADTPAGCGAAFTELVGSVLPSEPAGG